MNIEYLLGGLLGCAVTIFILMWVHHKETIQRIKDWQEIQKKYGRN